jgi:Helix-turn-helix domain
MKTARNKLPTKKALLSSTAAASMVPNITPEVDVGDDDEDQLVRTSDAAHKLRVSENTVRKYMKQGLLDRIQIGTRTVRTSRRSLSRLMGQQAAE